MTHVANWVPLSIDLVPLFPIKGDLATLFSLVRKTLLEERPDGWEPYLTKYIEVDRPQGQGFVDLVGQNRNMLVAAKVLNYNPGPNFIWHQVKQRA